MTKQTKKPGDFLIQMGGMLALLAALLFFVSLIGKGSGNPALLIGLLVGGVVLAVLGYWKRRGSLR